MGTDETSSRILLVEDEAHLAEGLRLNFELEGFKAAVAGTTREATALMEAEPPDVILLDVMLPDETGFEFCRRLRDSGNRTPIIMLTARDDTEDRVAGLDAGADDYIVKPFELGEVLARVRSALRRRRWERGSRDNGSSPWVTFGHGRVNFDTHEAEIGGETVRLTALEVELVRFFVDHAGRVIERRELLEEVWKLRNYPNTRTVDNFVGRLRKYFEPDPGRPRYILSVRGAGYRFVSEGDGSG